MKYLNLGCGSHYSTEDEWINLDFNSNSKDIIAHNLLNGIPFKDNYFDFVYHSHVLEHFSKEDGNDFIAECYRVLKYGGILRIVFPDLETIVRKYLILLDEGLKNPDNTLIMADYDWMLLEMYDQTVRREQGGNMGKYLCQKSILNEKFVFERIGAEAISYREYYFLGSNNPNQTNNKITFKKIKIKTRKKIKQLFFKVLNIDQRIYELGQYRSGGEVHQWMYDRYSLTRLLKGNGFVNIQEKKATESNIKNWESYQLDSVGGIIRKPDSLFMEAFK